MRASRAGARARAATMPGCSTTPQDSVVGRLDGRRRCSAFDVTDFLDHELMRAPVTLYLFHRDPPAARWAALRVLDGRVLAAARRSGVRELRQGWAEDLAQAEWRDVPCDAERERRAREPDQPHDHRADADQDLLPESRCQRGEYIEGFGLTEREFKLIKEQLEPGSRQFLVKQGHYSAWSASSTSKASTPSSR